MAREEEGEERTGWVFASEVGDILFERVDVERLDELVHLRGELDVVRTVFDDERQIGVSVSV